MAVKINLSRWLLRSAHSVLLCSVKTLPSGNFPFLLPSLPIADLPLDLFKRPLQRIEVERFAGTLLEAPRYSSLFNHEPSKRAWLFPIYPTVDIRSEERRVGKECRSGLCS